MPQNVPQRAKWKGLTAADGKPYNIGKGGPAGSFVAIDSTRYSVTAAFGQGASRNNGVLYLGGTAVLIVVGVALDTMKQLETQLLMRQYKGFIK